MSNRFGSSEEQYRFAFNGKEFDLEVAGNGNQYDYGFRIYNPRIGRFLSVDPLTASYPWYTPYQFAGNMPIAAIDLDGKEPDITNDDVIVGYWVQQQVPGLTYIEKDIKENYGSCMNIGNADWNWEDIVNWNKNYFSNVKGDKYDKYNKEYSKGSGVIHPGQYLDLSFISPEAAKEKMKNMSPEEKTRYKSKLTEFLEDNINPYELQKFQEAFASAAHDILIDESIVDKSEDKRRTPKGSQKWSPFSEGNDEPDSIFEYEYKTEYDSSAKDIYWESPGYREHVLQPPK